MACLREVASDLSSRSSSGLEDSVRIRLSFGGCWKLQAGEKWEYVDGETYLEKLSLFVKYADLMHIVNEKINRSAIFKYTPPGEALSPYNLVTVVDDDHVQEMIDDYMMAVHSHEPYGKRLRLNVWISEASEEVVTEDDMFIRSSTSGSSMSDESAMLDMAPAWPMRNPSCSDDEEQAMVAQEACLYMNALEEAEEQMTSSDDWQLISDLAVLEDISQEHGEYEDSPGNAEGSVIDIEREAAEPKNLSKHITGSLEPGTRGTNSTASTAKPETPPNDQQKTCKLPSSLGSSLGHTRDQPSTSKGLSSFGLPSKLGSSLGNPRCGTLLSSHLPRGPSVVYEPPESTSMMPACQPHQRLSMMPILPSEGPTEPSQDNQDPPPEEPPQREPPRADRTTPNGTAISPQHSMDHFHIVPVSQLVRKAKLGEGSFGEVVHCTNRLFGDIAVKCAKAEGDQDLFSLELRMLSSLNHPNVLRFFGVVTDDTQESKIVGVMTEFMQGRSLSYYLAPEVPRWSLLERAKLARGAVNGLMYLHQHNIIHFDLKPENLLLDYPLVGARITPGIKVADFGLSRYKVDSDAAAEFGLRGTLPYMAPEIVAHGAHVTEKADIWSLGMVLWEMFTHSVPFGNTPPAEITARLQSGNAFPHIPPDMEQEWAELIEACCRPAPNDRFSLENLAAMLDQIIQSKTHRGLLY